MVSTSAMKTFLHMIWAYLVYLIKLKGLAGSIEYILKICMIYSQSNE